MTDTESIAEIRERHNSEYQIYRWEINSANSDRGILLRIVDSLTSERDEARNLAILLRSEVCEAINTEYEKHDIQKEIVIARKFPWEKI